MKELSSIALVLLSLYLMASIFLYFYQRKMLYFPVPVDPAFKAEEILLKNQGVTLHGWVLNPGRQKGMIYFGGNSETITHNSEWFQSAFSDYSIYLFNYRGYGNSEGKPTEQGLLSDALAIYDHLQDKHDSLSAYGRSLGSGPAAYLASQRTLERLILLTPYDSVANVAQKLYPIFPVKLLIKDRFDSASVADKIKIPVLLVTAQNDKEIPLSFSLALKQSLVNADVHYLMIEGAAHNDIIEYPRFLTGVSEFVRGKTDLN
ncbi:MAG: alpha/beta hydrolase [Pseudomonadota bacterium]